MPSLPAPVPRRPVHTRRISFEGFLRDDGLWDIDCQLSDTKAEAIVMRERGVLPPSEFLAATERNGMIVDLGRFVLHTACQHAAGWRRKQPWLTVAVNVSERELFDPDFTAQVAGVLAATGLPPEALVLEVTETVLAADVDVREGAGDGVEAGREHDDVELVVLDRRAQARLGEGLDPVLPDVDE